MNVLKSKPIRSDRQEDDGIRISIMNRHTLNDGITPDSSISTDMFDIRWPQLSPPDQLLGDYYKRGATWEEFDARYTDHLETKVMGSAIWYLANLALKENVTVLCTEDNPQMCHRRLVVNQCQLLMPNLATDIS